MPKRNSEVCLTFFTCVSLFCFLKSFPPCGWLLYHWLLDIKSALVVWVLKYWIINYCSSSECMYNIMTSSSPILSNSQSFILFFNLVIQWSWVSLLSIVLVQKNLNLSGVRFFFDMKCVVKMVVGASYESAAGVSVENSFRSFWLSVARRAAFF